jgi:hypothetical protein
VVKLGAASITCDAMHRNAGTWNTQHDAQIAALRDLTLALADICGPFYPEVRAKAEKVRGT